MHTAQKSDLRTAGYVESIPFPVRTIPDMDYRGIARCQWKRRRNRITRYREMSKATDLKFGTPVHMDNFLKMHE